MALGLLVEVIFSIGKSRFMLVHACQVDAAQAPGTLCPSRATQHTPSMLARRSGPLGHLDLDESEGAPPVSEQVVSALMVNAGRVLDLFRSWDIDEDGTIIRAEFHRAMVELGLEVPGSAIDEIFSAWDNDNSGSITHAELTSILRAASTAKKNIVSLRRILAKQRLKIVQAFRDWDTDNSGEIDADEFTRALESVGLDLSKAQNYALFNSIDRDSSGQISFQELHKVLHVDSIKEEENRRRRATAARKATIERMNTEELIDIASLRKSTLSKLQAFDEQGWKSDNDLWQLAVDDEAAESAVAAAVINQRLLLPPKPISRSPSPEASSLAQSLAASPVLNTRGVEAAERQRRRMCLRLRGTGLVDEQELEQPYDPSMTRMLRRLPRSSSPRHEQHRGRPSHSRNGMRAVLEPTDAHHPQSLPKLLDVLSVHRTRVPVPIRHSSLEVHFSLSQLPGLSRGHTPPVVPMRDPKKLRSAPKKPAADDGPHWKVGKAYGSQPWAASPKTMQKSASCSVLSAARRELSMELIALSADLPRSRRAP